MKFLFFLLSFFTISYSYAQRQNVYFLKNSGRYVNVRDSADFTRVVKEPDSGSTLYNISEFYKNGKIKLAGKSSRIDPPLFEGTCARFYKTGVRRSTTNYKAGRVTGSEFDFFPNGKLYLVKEYTDDFDIFNNNFLITSCRDSSGKVLTEDGNGYFKSYSSDPMDINEEGNVKNGKREGTWKGSSINLKVTFTEEYSDGKLVNGAAVHEDGKSTTYTKTRGNPPEFKGGVAAFGKYLSTGINYPVEARKNNIQGIVFLTFVVERDATLSDIKVQISPDPILSAEAVRVLRNSPKWIPGVQFGVPVRINYTVPISFYLRN